MIKPLTDKSLTFETCLIVRADEESRAVNELCASISQEVRPATGRRKTDGFAATRLRLDTAQMRFVRGDIELVLRNHVAM